MSRKNTNLILVVTAAAFCAAASTTVRATTVDLISGNTGTVNGAIFNWDASVRAGTGIFGTFVKIQDHGSGSSSEQGYNTSGRPVPFDEKTALPHTHNIQFGNLIAVTVDSVDYFQFLLDIDESNKTDSVLSLDGIKIFTSPTGSQTTTNVESLGTKRYDLDLGGDSEILLDHARAPGSGKSDMEMLVPVSFFAGALATDYVYLWSQFGLKGIVQIGPNEKKDILNYGSSSGPEEWASQLKDFDDGDDIPGVTVPAPAALPAGLALLGLATLRRRRSA